MMFRLTFKEANNIILFNTDERFMSALTCHRVTFKTISKTYVIMETLSRNNYQANNIDVFFIKTFVKTIDVFFIKTYINTHVCIDFSITSRATNIKLTFNKNSHRKYIETYQTKQMKQTTLSYLSKTSRPTDLLSIKSNRF